MANFEHNIATASSRAGRGIALHDLLQALVFALAFGFTMAVVVGLVP